MSERSQWPRRLAIGVGLAILVGAGAWAAWPDPVADAQNALVAGLLQPAPLSPTAVAEAERALQAAGRYGGRQGPAAARALVMADPEALEAWARWVVSSARDEGEGELSPEAQAAVVGWLGRQKLGADALAVAKAWSLIQADRPQDVSLALPEPTAISEAWVEDALLAVIVAKEMVGADSGAELAALHDRSPTHRRACLPLLRAAIQDGRLRAVEGLALRCSAEGPVDAVIERAQATLADQLGRTPEARERYGRAGFGLHAAAVALQEGLVGAPEEWRAAIADPVPPAALHAVLGAILLGDVATLTEGLGRLEALGAFEGTGDPTFRVAAAAGALALGQPARARSAIGALDGPEAQTLLARALLAEGDAVGARAALVAARARRPAAPQLLLAWLRLFPEDAAQVAEVAAALDPIEVALEGVDLDRDRPWAALLPPGPAAPAPDFGLGALLPPGTAAISGALSTGRCPPVPADAPARVSAWCGDRGAAAGLGLDTAPLEGEGLTVGGLSLIARAAAASGDPSRCAAALDAASARAPGMVGLARERYWLLP